MPELKDRPEKRKQEPKEEKKKKKLEMEDLGEQEGGVEEAALQNQETGEPYDKL